MMNNPAFPVLEEVEFVGKNNFDFLDLTLEAPRSQNEDISIAPLKKKLKEYNLKVVGHTSPFLPWASQVKSLRKASLRELKENMKIFSELGVSKVNIHSHWYQPNCSVHDIVQRNIESLAELLEEADKHSLKLMLEHQPNGSLNQPSDLLPIFSALPKLNFHLDVGHANVAGQGKNLTEQFLKNFGKKLLHVHFSDNKGLMDDHLPLGAGKIDWKEVIELLKSRNYDDTITLEIFIKNRDLLIYSKDYLRKLWTSELRMKRLNRRSI